MNISSNTLIILLQHYIILNFKLLIIELSKTMIILLNSNTKNTTNTTNKKSHWVVGFEPRISQCRSNEAIT